MIIMKQAIVVRSDLKMKKGKIAAQSCHASVNCYKKSDRDNILEWERDGSKKVVLKVSKLQDLFELNTLAKELGVVSSLITDAGHTQVEPSTITCLGLGPADDEVIDKITGDLKLL